MLAVAHDPRIKTCMIFNSGIGEMSMSGASKTSLENLHTPMLYINGGTADVNVFPDKIVIVLEDHGPGIPDVELAMKEGYSTSTEQIRNLGFGAGLGLPNMKRYTDSLEIETKVGVGTKLTMVVGV